jgi:hypothetical protein
MSKTLAASLKFHLALVRQKATVYQADGQEIKVPFDQALNEGAVLPGFEVKLVDLFQ